MGEPIIEHTHGADGRCALCYGQGSAEGWEKGHESGEADGLMAGFESRPDPDTVRGWQAEELRDVAAGAHRAAGHRGRFEYCAEPMCQAIEEWLHHETRPVIGPISGVTMARMGG